MMQIKRKIVLGVMACLILGVLAELSAADKGSPGKTRQFTGVLQKVEDSSIEVAKKKETKNFGLTEKTRWRDLDKELVQKSQFSIGDKVTVKYRENGNGESTAISIWLKKKSSSKN